MFALLPLIALALLCLTFFRRGLRLRESVLSAAITWGALVALSTEALSAFRRLNFTWLLIWWAVVSVALTAFHLRGKAEEARSRTRAGDSVSPPLRAVLFSVALLVASLGVIAWVFPPNNWDSMTYHMSRVAHWAQNHSVGYYPTSIARQLYLSPGAEFIIAQFQILSGGDRFANLVQWLSMLGSLCGVSLIAARLGARAAGQALAAVFAATIPMGVLQASSTQNDHAVAFWLVCTVYFMLLLKRAEGARSRLSYSFALGAALALALLTKSTAYIIALPFCLWFILATVKSERRELLKSGMIITALVLLINAGYYSRNFRAYGSPFGPRMEGAPEAGHKFTNDRFTPATLVSNSVRNIALHVYTPSARVNLLAGKVVYKIHRIIGQDINDPGTTWGGTRFGMPTMSFSEDDAGNPIHLLLIAGSLPFFLLRRRLRGSSELLSYVCCAVAAFFLFSLVLRWQPWHSRLQLPMFILWSPFVAVVLSSLFKERVLILFAAGLLLASIPWVLFNKLRPLTGDESIFKKSRIDLTFNARPELKEPYVGAADRIKSRGCQRVGLLLSGDDWEYPFWVLLSDGNYRRPLITHLRDVNSGGAPTNDPTLNNDICAIISTSEARDEAAPSPNSDLIVAFREPPVTLFLKP